MVKGNVTLCGFLVRRGLAAFTGLRDAFFFMPSSFVGFLGAAAAAPLPRGERSGSKRKGASRETVKSNGVFAPISETASDFYGGRPLECARGWPLSNGADALDRTAQRLYRRGA